VITEPVSN